jgi:hypothetical protein
LAYAYVAGGDYDCSLPVTHWLSTASASLAFVSPVLNDPATLVSAHQSVETRSLCHQLFTPPTVSVLRRGPSVASVPHRQSAPCLHQFVSCSHLLHTDACPLSADTFRKLEHRLRRLFCLLLPWRYNRWLILPSTTGMVPCSLASRCWEIPQSIYVKVRTQYIIVLVLFHLCSYRVADVSETSK